MWGARPWARVQRDGLAGRRGRQGPMVDEPPEPATRVRHRADEGSLVGDDRVTQAELGGERQGAVDIRPVARATWTPGRRASRMAALVSEAGG